MRRGWALRPPPPAIRDPPHETRLSTRCPRCALVRVAVSVFRRWGWETVVFGGATAVALLHALDDAFLYRQPGVDLGQHVVAAVIALAAGVAAIVAFPRLRPGLRALLASVFGVLAVGN